MSNLSITKQQLEEAINKYDTKSDAAASLNISKKTYLRLLDKHGLVFKNKIDKLAERFSKQWLIDNYVNTLKSLGEVERENNLPKRSLECLCNKYDITKPYANWCNYDKLFDLTDPNVYYLGGLIATDGHIDRGGHRFGIGLSGDSERELLSEIAAYFEFNKGVAVRREKEYSIMASGKDIGKFYLENFGIQEMNKTFIVGVPKCFYNENCAKMYVRGCIDGDGCITHLNSNSPTFSLLAASKDLVFGLYNIILSYVSISLKYSEHKYYDITCAGIHVKNLLDWVYSYDGFKLNRKYEKYLIVKSKY